MRIIVVGGSGFIGTHLVAALLQRGHEVRIFDCAGSLRYPERVLRGDVRDAGALLAALRDYDAAIDLAAEHRDDVRPLSLYAEVNVAGARHLAQAATANRVMRVVFVSSAAVYGRDQPGADEQAPLHPARPYGRSKAEAEAVHRAWAAADTARSLSIVRPSIVYGPGSRGNMQRLVEQLRAHRFAFAGHGGNRKSIAYVGNLVDFLCTCLEHRPGLHCYNYADPPAPTTASLVEAIQSLLPRPQRVVPRLPRSLVLAGAHLLAVGAHLRGRRPGITAERVRSFCADTTISTSALDATGFRRRHDLRGALRAMIEADPTR